MRGAGTLLLIAAWAALSLPWERCVAECHEHLRPAGHGHADQARCCGEHEHEHEPEHEHESLRFESVSPSKLVFEVPLAVHTSEGPVLPAPHVVPAIDAAPRDTGPAPGLTTVVLLL